MQTDTPRDLRDHAVDNLRFIRETMERAGAFTSIPGWGGVLVGLTAFVAAAVAFPIAAPQQWLAVWLVDAVIAALIGGWTMDRKARRNGMQLLSAPGRRFLYSYGAPLVVGAILTAVLYQKDMFAIIPGVWLLLYGTAFITAGSLSIPLIPLMGICFMILGSVTFFIPFPWSNLSLAAGFGGLHVIFGWIIARRYGG